MNLKISDHFTTRTLLRYTLPTIVMMIFTSVYSIVDGLFVSNFVGKTPFAAINFIYPVFMVIGSVGFMMGTGGCALVAKTLGEGNQEKANRIFSLVVYVTFGVGVALSTVGFLLVEPISRWLGAEGELLADCVRYGRILFPALPMWLLQTMFQPFVVAAERPTLGLLISVGAGVANIVLDYLFIIPFGWGLEGAALATALSQCVGGLVPLIFFLSHNGTTLRIGPTRWDGKALAQTCLNGSSEMATNISASIVVMLYNAQLLRYIGENGVAAFGVVGYVQFIFIAVFLGYSIGSAPIVSYNHGAQRHGELHGVVRRSFRLMVGFGVLLTALAELLAEPLSHLFVGYDQELFALTTHALQIYSLSFLICGLNIYTSSLFTALNNGVVSAVVSFSRTLIFECGAVLLIPRLLGIDGIWWSVSFAEVAALALCAIFLVRYKERYHY